VADTQCFRQRKAGVTAAQQNRWNQSKRLYLTLELKPMNTQVPEQIVAAQKVGVEAPLWLF
jgi:hypothetical protein